MKTLFIPLLCLALMPESIISSKEATLAKLAKLTEKAFVDGLLKGFDKEISSADLFRILQSVGPKLIEGFNEGLVEGLNESFDMGINSTDLGRIMLSVGPKLVEGFVDNFVKGLNEEFVLGESFDMEISKDDLRRVLKSLGSKLSDKVSDEVLEKADADDDGLMSDGDFDRILSSEELGPRRRSIPKKVWRRDTPDDPKKVWRRDTPDDPKKVWRRDTPDDPKKVWRRGTPEEEFAKPQAVEKGHGDGFGDHWETYKMQRTNPRRESASILKQRATILKRALLKNKTKLRREDGGRDKRGWWADHTDLPLRYR